MELEIHKINVNEIVHIFQSGMLIILLKRDSGISEGFT
ncbi:hypothetical protein FLCU109888_13125 [Flavobacterium cucumis]